VIADDLEGRRCVFLAGLYRAEREIAEKLTALAAGRPPWPLIDADKAIPWVEQRTKLALAESQIAAVRVALASKVMVITGRLAKASARARSSGQPRPRSSPGRGRRAKLIALIKELYLSFRGCGTCGVVVNAFALSTNPQAGPLRYSLAFHSRRSKKPKL
jgi:hypothetical protein